MPTDEERWLATAIYGISFFTVFIGPLVIWLLKRNDSPFIDAIGKEYVNFLISYSIYTFISFLLMILIVGIFMLWVVGILSVVFTVVAAIKAFQGQEYRIPFVFRLIR
jgi:uncharacterized protein